MSRCIRQAAEAAGELQPVHAWHAVIEQQQVGAVAAAPVQGQLGIAEVVHRQLAGDVLDHVTQHGPRRPLVVDDDDVQFTACAVGPALLVGG